MKWIIRIDRTNYELDDRADLQRQVVERRVRPEHHVYHSIFNRYARELDELKISFEAARRNAKLGLDLYMSLGAAAVRGCTALRRAA
jgi:hypothetical protein